MIPRLLFDAYCPCFLVALWSACFICFYFHLPPQSLLTVGQHRMVTLPAVPVVFSLEGWMVCLLRRQEQLWRAWFPFIIIHSFFLRYLHILHCIWSCVLFLLKESRKLSFIFDITPNTNAVIVRLLCSERVRKREGEMDGWRGWKELWEGGQACVHMCECVREREREGAQCSILRASRHCAGWEKRQLNPRSRKNNWHTD